jgi:hypothetical protein
VDPASDSLLLRKSGRAGNGTRTSGSVARTTEAVCLYSLQNNYNYKLNDDGMDKECSTHREEEDCILRFGVKVRRIDSTRKT